MNPKNLKAVVKSYHNLHRSLCVEGSPGVGKTQIIQAAAQELGIKCITKHLPTMLVEDFGILFPNGDNSLHYRLPDWFPTLEKDGESGILLFDDRNQGGNDLQKVLANIIQARELHGHRLPDGWSVMSTGNRQKDRAGSNKVLSHLRNRETLVELDVKVEDWVEWASGQEINPFLISFAMFRPQLLNNFEPNQDVNATPRSWVEGVGRVMDNAVDLPAETQMECFAGAVGEGPAGEFLSFMKVAESLPSVEDILADVHNYPVPTEVSIRYALTGALASATTHKNFGALTDFYLRWDAREFSVLWVRMMSQYPDNKAYVTWKGWKRWAEKFQDLIITH